jgi:hypothetical protein
MRLKRYVDVDWAGSAVDWKSTSDSFFTLGYAWFLGAAGNILLWL